MESNYYESALNSLSKTQHKRRLLQILMVIRKATTSGPQQAENVNKLYRKGSLKYLIGCLNSDSSNVVDITLSVLGNLFCICSNCCRDAVQMYNIQSQLSNVLDKYEGDSIKGRLFRIIGNLNKHEISYKNIKLEPKLIKRIVTFLDDVSTNSETNISEATISMAIRSLRKFISNDTIVAFIFDYNALKVIGQILVKYTPKYDVHKEYRIVIEDVLRLLLVFSKYKYAESVPKLKTAETGDPLLSLSSLAISYPTRVLKILFNFAACVLAKTDFHIKIVAQKLVAELKKVYLNKTIEKETLFKERLKALCDLLEYPVYRVDAKEVGGFNLLLDVLESMTLPTNFNLECCHIILSALISCKSDETTMTKETSIRIVSILTLKLKWIFGDASRINTDHAFKSLEIKLRMSCNAILKGRKRLKKDISKIYFDSIGYSDDSSPERCVSPCSSDISSNPNSPNYVINIDDQELSDSDNYSPICSDDEVSEPLSPQTEECALSDQEDIYSGKEFSHSAHLFKSSIENKIHVLLKWYVEIKPPIMEMANEQLLILLINGTLGSANDDHKMYDLVLKILGIDEYLMPVLLTNIIPVLYDLKVHIHSNTCSDCIEHNQKALKIITRISSLAESPCGEGVIAHQLYRADVDIKQKLALKIPYVIRNMCNLSKLMLNYGGLNVLLKLLENESDVQEKSIKALCVLAVQLKIRNSVSMKSRGKQLIIDIRKCALLNDNDTVTFKLDDGNRVQANRNFLSGRSEYFSVLLYGDFKESGKEEVELHNVSSKSLQYLFNLMQYETTQYQYMPLNVELETVLDIIALAEQYLILELSAFLANSIEQKYFTPKNVPVIYKWSIESATNILRIESTAYALVAKVVDSERQQMFQKIFNSGLTEYIIEDIKTLLNRFLQ